MATNYDKYLRKATVFDVRIARAAGVLHTLEGPVAYQAGDALVTGARREQWPIQRQRFENLYEPADADTAMGQDGLYIRKTTGVRATQAVKAMEIALSGGRGALKVNAGDWVVRDAQGERWVVADGIFQETYIPLGRALDRDDWPRVRSTGRHSVNLLLVARSAGPYLFAFLTLLLGMVGHWLNVERPFTLADGVDAFLGSARYLVFDGFQAPDEGCADTTDICTHPNGAWFVRSAQLSAVFFVIATADQVLRHLGGGLTRVRFNLRAQFGHRLDLVIGMGWHGSTLVESMRLTCGMANEARRTLCIDLSPSAQATEICRHGRILLLQADADTDALFRAINLTRVDRVFLSVGSDATSAAVLRRLAGKVARRTQRASASRRPACFVSVDTFRVFDALLDASVKRTLDIRPFNDAATTARLLCMRQHEAYSFTTGVKTSRLVLWGDGAMSDAILLHWQQNHVIEAGIRVQVDVVHPQGHAAALRYAELHPCFRIVSPSHEGAPTMLLPDAVWVDEQVLPTLVFHAAPVSARGQIEWIERYLDAPGGDTARTTVVVALADLADSVNVSRAIQPSLMVRAGADVAGPGGVSLWIYLNTRDEDLFDGLEASFQQDGDYAVVFRDHLGEYSKACMTDNVIERAGIWTHAAYSGAQNATPEDMLALWHGNTPDLPGGAPQPPADEWARESSRLAGAHAWVKRGIATRLAASGSASEESILGELARVEHRRWCAVHLLLGWRPLVGPDPRDWTARERKDALAWYSGDNNRFREQRLHLYLMTLAQLELVGSAVGLGDAAAATEHVKDRQIVVANESILAFARTCVHGELHWTERRRLAGEYATMKAALPARQSFPHIEAEALLADQIREHGELRS